VPSSMPCAVSRLSLPASRLLIGTGLALPTARTAYHGLALFRESSLAELPAPEARVLSRVAGKARERARAVLIAPLLGRCRWLTARLAASAGN
jgi:hypothetical protein